MYSNTHLKSRETVSLNSKMSYSKSDFVVNQKEARRKTRRMTFSLWFSLGRLFLVALSSFLLQCTHFLLVSFWFSFLPLVKVYTRWSPLLYGLNIWGWGHGTVHHWQNPRLIHVFSYSVHRENTRNIRGFSQCTIWERRYHLWWWNPPLQKIAITQGNPGLPWVFFHV